MRSATALGQPLTGPTSSVTSAAFSADGHTLAAGNADQTVRLWKLS
jgi:WD40 repeat protein